MKYIVMRVDVEDGISREFPVIFPDSMSHVDMAASTMVALQKDHKVFSDKGRNVIITPVAAGELSLFGFGQGRGGCSGHSVTLGGLKSRGDVDAELISMNDYNKGIV